MEQYSFALCPPPYIIGEVKKMKEELRQALGKRYGSVNSDAHITFNVFACGTQELQSRIKAVRIFCGLAFPKEVLLMGFGNYPNGAFFLSPDNDSTYYIKELMRRFHELHSGFESRKSADPHMTIGRGLSDEQLQEAYKVFESRNPELRFVCDRIGLRRFNKSRLQYDLVEQFPFLSTGKPVERQGLLDL